MRLLVVLILALLASTAIGLILKEDPGFVVMGYQYWTLEMSLGLFVLLILVGFMALYALIRLSAYTFGMPARLKGWQVTRKRRHARKQLSQGLIALSEGRWDVAEKRLSRSAAACDVPLLNYLGAARAAQQKGADDQRDLYLRQAHDSDPAAELAVGLTQAELQLAHNQLEQALATLSTLRDIAPKHAYVLRLLMKLYRQLSDWDQLKALLPELKKRKVVSEEEERELNLDIYGHMLNRAGEDAEAVTRAWNELPKHLRQEDRLLLDYIERLHKAERDEEAEKLIREGLKRGWSIGLIEWLGVVRFRDIAEQLNLAEGWLEDQPRNPVLLLTLARICRWNQLWGKARSYLEASLGCGPRPETFRELGDLLNQLGEQDRSTEAYRKGLLLAVGEEVSNDLDTPLTLPMNNQASSDKDDEDLERAVPTVPYTAHRA